VLRNQPQPLSHPDACTDARARARTRAHMLPTSTMHWAALEHSRTRASPADTATGGTHGYRAVHSRALPTAAPALKARLAGQMDSAAELGTVPVVRPRRRLSLRTRRLGSPPHYCSHSLLLARITAGKCHCFASCRRLRHETCDIKPATESARACIAHELAQRALCDRVTWNSQHAAYGGLAFLPLCQRCDTARTAVAATNAVRQQSKAKQSKSAIAARRDCWLLRGDRTIVASCAAQRTQTHSLRRATHLSGGTRSARQRVRLGLQRTLRQVVLFGGAQYDGLTADVHIYERPAERHVRPWAPWPHAPHLLVACGVRCARCACVRSCVISCVHDFGRARTHADSVWWLHARACAHVHRVHPPAANGDPRCAALRCLLSFRLIGGSSGMRSYSSTRGYPAVLARPPFVAMFPRAPRDAPCAVLPQLVPSAMPAADKPPPLVLDGMMPIGLFGSLCSDEGRRSC
jgi:hypothetical protein